MWNADEYCVDASVKVGFEFDYKLSFQKVLLQLLMGKMLRQKNKYFYQKFGADVLRMF